MGTVTGLRVDVGMDWEGARRSLETLQRNFDRLVVLMARRDRYLVTLPGDWPDKYVLFNRFVRTGRRPRTVIIPIDHTHQVR